MMGRCLVVRELLCGQLRWRSDQCHSPIHRATASNALNGFAVHAIQLVSTYRPGSMDTSLISTDSINNPRTMNAVYDFPSRMGLAKNRWHEKLAGGELNNKQFNDFVSDRPLTGFYCKADALTHTPRLL